MDDTISRAAVLRILYRKLSNGFRDYNGDWNEPTINKDAIDKVKALPSAQPGWIPCSRELPKNKGKYYVTQHQYGAYDPNMTGTYVCNTDYIFYSVRHSRWLKDMNCKVVAWMPLPKPWEGEKDDG